MKTRAAVLRKGGEAWELGTARLPLVGGHEGVGVIEKTDPSVTRVTISAAPQACADCLVPKDLMRGTLGLPEDAIDLMHPLDSPPER